MDDKRVNFLFISHKTKIVWESQSYQKAHLEQKEVNFVKKVN